MISSLHAQLDAARKELLDLGLRNPLLNHRTLKARGVAIVDERPADVLARLWDGKAFTFEAAPEPTGVSLENTPLGDTAEDDAGETVGVAPRGSDSRLTTPHPAPELEARLLATYLAARTFLEEQGANVLYLALGMLEWRDADKPDIRRAPLLLVPVTLARTTFSRYSLRWNGEEVGGNLSLEAKLRADFNVGLPMPPDDIDVTAYFDAVAVAVAARGWRVDRTAVALGFFGFGKFLMYRDLDVTTWPEGLTSTVLASLLETGFHEAPPTLNESDALDARVPPDVPAAVVDLDGSQALAVLAAREGRNLVIQGPPGTGKSQTITNMIADALARGKTVLFVAEKMAALDVVKRRLDATGLGDACLELHSHKASKKAVLDELGRTLALGRPRMPATAADDAGLHAELRDRLNAYAAASSTLVGESGVSPHEAIGGLLSLWREAAASRLPEAAVPTGLEAWPRALFQRRAGLVAELAARLVDTGPVPKHPYVGARLTNVPPGFDAALADDLRATRTVTGSCPDASWADAATGFSGTGPPRWAGGLAEACRPLAEVLGIPEPATRDAALALALAGERAGRGPDLTGVAVQRPGWVTERARIQAVLDTGERLAGLQARFGDAVVPGAWAQDLTAARAAIAAHGGSFFRFFFSAWRNAQTVLKGIARDTAPRGREAQLALLDALADGRQLAHRLHQDEPFARALFGGHWAGESSDWAALRAITGWLCDLHEEVQAQRLPVELLTFLATHRGSADLGPALARASGGIEAFDAAWARLTARLEHAPLAGEPALGETPFADLAARLTRWLAAPESLQALAAFNRMRVALASEGLGALADYAASLSDVEAASHLPDALARSRYEALLDRALRERPALQAFDGAGHEIQRDRFRTLDTLVLAHTRAKLALAHWEGLPRSEGAGQWALLRRELEKRARWLPLRQLVAKAGNAVQAIKPVFMMSPLSIATFLPPGALHFDLIVFDEASQVKPVDAFGAILRGSQVVVVGDKRQMPPTSFFDSVVGGSDDTPADEDALATTDYESVLGLFEAQGAPQHMLRWHYRSRHESLIAVSNRAFYDGRLVVFPSPDADRSEAGLHFHHLPDAVYDRGATRSNPREAQAVAEAVMVHAQTRPRQSLGVAAFSVAQATAIHAAVEGLRRQHPETEAFFNAAHPHEPFFVKNLETVQGDERDTILVSVGYGPDLEGKLTMSFGPLNLEGGERRLNVLITRARLNCEVFSALTGDMIRADAGSPRGVSALKLFLTYAQTGVLLGEAAQAPDAYSETGFADAVAATLEAGGWTVARGVGVEGGRIDVAVVDPHSPGRFLLGVLCDGPAYGAARTARDRDRLREQVLQGLGWRLTHAWSVDWLRRPDHERRKLLAFVADAAAAQAPHLEQPASPLVEIQRDAATAPAASAPIPAYRMAAPKVKLDERDLGDFPLNVVAGWVAEVVAVEGPVAIGEVSRRIATAGGVKRPGARFKSALDDAVAFASRLGIERRGDFLWVTGMVTPPLRDRSALPTTSRKVEWVPPEEVALALVRAVTDAWGLTAEQAISEGLKLLGFARPGDAAKAVAEAVLTDLLQAGTLVRRGELVMAEA